MTTWAYLVFQIVARKAVAAAFLFYAGTGELPKPVEKALLKCNWQVKLEVFNVARYRCLLQPHEKLMVEYWNEHDAKDYRQDSFLYCFYFVRWYRLGGRPDPPR